MKYFEIIQAYKVLVNRMNIVTYEKKKPLNNSLSDFIFTKIEFDKDSKKLISFCVSQIYYSEEKIHEIIRFDTAHGNCHIHRFYRELSHKGERIINREISQEGFNECREDIGKDWKKYKKWFKEKWLER